MATYKLSNVANPFLLLPRGEFCGSWRTMGLEVDEVALRRQTRERLARHGIPFDWDQWERVSIHPYRDGSRAVYLGVTGETTLVEGQHYVNDVIAGETLYLSLDDYPFFCVHRGVYYTSDELLCARNRQKEGTGTAEG